MCSLDKCELVCFKVKLPDVSGSKALFRQYVPMLFLVMLWSQAKAAADEWEAGPVRPIQSLGRFQSALGYEGRTLPLPPQFHLIHHKTSAGLQKYPFPVLSFITHLNTE